MEKQPPQPFTSPYLVVSIGILAVSSSSIFIRLAQQEVGSVVIAFYRVALATLVLFPIAILKHKSQLFSLSKKQLKWLLFSGLFLAVHLVAWVSAVGLTSIASAVVLVSTTPLWVALLSPFTIKEPISIKVLIGLSIALLGSFVIGVNDICQTSNGFQCPPLSQLFSGQALLGDALALLGAWMAAGYVIIGKKLRENIPLLPYTFFVYCAAAVFLACLVVLRKLPIAGFSNKTYLWLFIMALLTQIIAHTSYNWALGYLPATVVSILLLGDPIGSIAMAALLLTEKPELLKLFGAGMILGGIMVATIKKKSHRM